MENPKQTFYAPEELFALKPEPIKIAEVKPVTPAFVVNKEVPAVVVEPNTSKLDLWGKHKAILIIGGVIFLGSIGLFFYRENQKKKKNDQKN